MIFLSTIVNNFLDKYKNIYIYIYIYNSEGVANYWVEKSSYTRLIIREWKIIIQLYDKNNRKFINLI